MHWYYLLSMNELNNCISLLGLWLDVWRQGNNEIIILIMILLLYVNRIFEVDSDYNDVQG